MLWWTDDLKIGVENIDNQHKMIFDKANDIFNLGINAKKEEIEKVFIFLMEYTTNHFFEEEELMRLNDFPYYENHKKSHSHFMGEVKKLYDGIVNHGISEDDLNRLKVLIIELLGWHISKEDQLFVDFINGHEDLDS